MRNCFLAFIFIVFADSFLCAQTDSILQYIQKLETQPNYKKDTNYILSLNACTEALWRGGKLDEAFEYAKKSIQLSKANNFLKGEGVAYNSIGIVYWYKGQYDSAIVYFQKSLPIVQQFNNKKGEANCLNNIGMLHATKGEYQPALSYFFKSLKIHEELNNGTGVASCYNNMGIIYKNQKEYDKALSYYFKSLALYEKDNKNMDATQTLNNIGVLYDLKHLPDSALYFYNKAVAIHEKYDMKEDMSSLYINLGIIYFNKKEYSQAEVYVKKAIENSEINNQQYTQSEGYANLGAIYFAQNKLDQAIVYLKKAYDLGVEIEALPIQRDVSLKLSNYYKKTNNSPLALKYLEKHLSLKDSLFNEEIRESTLKMQLQYEYEKKELQDSVKFEKITAQKDLELADEKTTKYLLFGGIAFSIILSLVAFRAYSTKKAANKEIHAQKELIEVQKNIVEVKQKEIIDSISYAKRLQEAILPSEKILKQHLPQHFILYKPKDIVAGDFYWLEVVDGIKFIAVADCTGHGVPGAMVSVVCSNALNRALLEFGLREPGQILDKTRELVLETFSKNDSNVRDGMDISLCSIVKSGEAYKIKWSGANNPLWYFQKGNFDEIKAHKQPIGKTENATSFPTHTIDLLKGDAVYLITDGYGDQFGGPQGKKYKSKKLQTTIASIQTKSINEQKEFLNTTFEHWKSNLEQIDDVTIMGILL